MTRKKVKKAFKKDGRDRATEINNGEVHAEDRKGTSNETPTELKIKDARSIHLSKRDVTRLSKLRRLVLSANSHLNVGRARNSKRICIDSGATITLLKKQKWLRILLKRIKMFVKTATGVPYQTQGHGPLELIAKDTSGKLVGLGNVGQGFLLDGLTHQLLSVSQMCAHGCTVVFKPKEAFMLTKEGNRIPFTEERGLYFLSHKL